MATPRRIGMVGGLGPESTIDYYRLLIQQYRARVGDGSYPLLVINSLDVEHALALLDAGDLTRLAAYMADGVELLARAGADFGLIAANTPHVVFDEVCRRSSLPLLSIVEATCARVAKDGRRRAGLLGTRFTMSGRFYPAAFERAGLELFVPDASEQAAIHEKYIGELLRGVFLPATRAAILDVSDRLCDRHGIDALVLAGTELPLLLRGETPGIAVYDTTQIHVDAAIDELLGN
jgi:aspartate racemase